MTDIHSFLPQQNVQPIRPQHPAPPDIEPVVPQLSAGHIRIISAAISILSLRLLAVIALLGAVGLFSITIYNPIEWRLYTAAAYAVVVLLPTIWLYARKAD